MIELADDYYFQAEPYRDTFIRGSVEADVNVFRDVTGQEWRFRDLFRYSLAAGSKPRRDIPRLTRHAALLALFPALALTGGWWLSAWVRPPRR